MTTITAFIDVKSLRNQARKHIELGTVTVGYCVDRIDVLKLLNEALAAESRRHQFIVRGIYVQSTTGEYLVHPDEGQGHADRIAARITQLGGVPDFVPHDIASRRQGKFVTFGSFVETIWEDLIVELVAIDSYRGLILSLGNQDPATRHMLQEILAVEEDHANQLADLLDGSLASY